jgi:chromosomal replication initiator protein
MDIWSKTLQAISKNLSKPAFDTWFANTSLVEIDYDTKTITVSVPNNFTRDWLETLYEALVEDCWAKETGELLAVIFVVEKPTSESLSSPEDLISAEEYFGQMTLEELTDYQERRRKG